MSVKGKQNGNIHQVQKRMIEFIYEPGYLHNSFHHRLIQVGMGHSQLCDSLHSISRLDSRHQRKFEAVPREYKSFPNPLDTQ